MDACFSRRLRSTDTFCRSLEDFLRPSREQGAGGLLDEHMRLCMLAYDLEWHLRQKWAPTLFEDDDRAAARAQRTSPAAKAGVPDAARRKARRKITATGQPLHRLRTLLDDLATLTRNEFTLPGGPANPSPCSQGRHPCRPKPSSASASDPQKVIPVALQVDFSNPFILLKNLGKAGGKFRLTCMSTRTWPIPCECFPDRE